MSNKKLTDGTLHDQLTDQDKSSMARYQELAIGSGSLLLLIKYELVMLFCSWVPGALGLLLRKWCYPTILGSVGRGVVFGRNVLLRHGHKIHIGDNVVIDDEVVLDAKGSTNSGIRIANDTIISRNVVLSCKNGDIKIGAHCTIGINSVIHATPGSDVALGDNVLVGAMSYFIGNGPYNSDTLAVPFKDQGVISQGGIKVENNVWFGSNVQVQDGVQVGSGAIVGTSSVLIRPVEKNSVVAGVPAKLIRQRE